ncbi:MAG: arginine--tRNA ligase [Desulfobacteraceae bacterium]|jgi:arginyl-tRNA synthetase|nr:arginine--tRNA ligase [Desulfobacteraceae bacterium]
MPVIRLKESLLEKIAAAAQKTYNQKPDGLEIGFPPSTDLGHFAVACFSLAKQLRTSPAEIAKKLAENMLPDDVLQKVTATGPYLNLTLSPGILFGEIGSEILAADSSFGESSTGRNKRVMVEYLSPNTNKPLHLGHLRNGALGMSVAKLYGATGHRVVRANLINDRGVHICKSMLAWQRWGDGSTPESVGKKGDHFVGDWYVRFAQEADKDGDLENQVQQLLLQWEAGDRETVDLWKTMNSWVYDGFSQTYRNFGLEFDVFYYESDTYKLGKDAIHKGLEAKVFTKDAHGNTVFQLPAKEFGEEKNGDAKKVTVLRPDGTSLYITQDIATSILKIEEHNLNFSIYVVGSEQEYHFKCLFQILADLGYGWARDCYHLSYGMVYLPEGKMKSREGKIVDADDLIAEMKNLAAGEIRRRDPDRSLSDDEVKRRAEIIGIGAVKFYLLRVRPPQSINFDPAESISFDGFTGPYCQYAYARIFGILEKAASANLNLKNADFSLLGNAEELQLLQKLMAFPEEVEGAARELNPSRIAVHVFNTAKAFNQFYNRHQVVQAGNDQRVSARLALIKATAVVLKKGLDLLGIDVLENM